MKRLLLSCAGAFAFVFTAQTALAAPPPPVVALFNWTGFYVGVQGGYQWARGTGTNDNFIFTTPDPSTTNATGGVFGGHVGFNYQTGVWVLGIEADLETADVNGTGISGGAFGGPRFHSVKTDWQGSVRGRLGVAMDRMLWYVTGGWAYTHDTHAIGFPGGPPYHTFSHNRDGWTLGAGLEWAFTNNLTARVEYRYADYGPRTVANAVANSGDISKITSNTVRVGLTWKW